MIRDLAIVRGAAVEQTADDLGVAVGFTCRQHCQLGRESDLRLVSLFTQGTAVNVLCTSVPTAAAEQPR
jgi:hypothetical protein